MGARASRLRPEVVNQLKEETDFSDEEIRRYYRKFRKDYCEQGTMDVCESTFLERCLAGKASFYMEDCRRFASEVSLLNLSFEEKKNNNNNNKNNNKMIWTK